MLSDLPDYQTFREERYFASLDGLRCISIIAVIFHHTTKSFFPNDVLFRQGYLGVQFFFGISGFLITTLLLREKEITGTISIKNFMTRRIFRIFPLYYTVLLLYVILIPLTANAIDQQKFFSNLPYYATYTSNWFINQDQTRIPFYLAWSLAVEEQFYLVWPWIEKYIKPPKQLIVLISLLIAYEILSIELSIKQGYNENFFYTLIINISPAICMGVILAHTLQNKVGFYWASTFLGRKTSSLVFAVLLFLSIAFLHSSVVFIQFIMVLMVGACVIRKDHLLSPFLTLPIVQQIGKVSYGMYLFHLLVYHFILQTIALKFDLVNPFFLFPSTCLLTFIVAEMSFNYYESYFLNIKKSFMSKTQN